MTDDQKQEMLNAIAGSGLSEFELRMHARDIVRASGGHIDPNKLAAALDQVIGDDPALKTRLAARLRADLVSQKGGDVGPVDGNSPAA